MDNLEQAKSEITTLIGANNLPEVFKKLLALLPESSAKSQEVILLKGRMNDINLKSLRGTISDDDLRVEYNVIREKLLELLNDIDQGGYGWHRRSL